MPLKTYADPRRLIDTTEFEINGEALTASRYGTPNRIKGRRIVVRDAKGIVRFDTDDHHDNANAVNAFDTWRTTRVKRQEYRVQITTGSMLIAAKSQAEAEQFAVDDGHRLAPAEGKEALIEKIMEVVDEVEQRPDPTSVPGAAYSCQRGDGRSAGPATSPESREQLIEKIMAVVEETVDYAPEPYPVDVKLVDEGCQDRDVCDDTSKPTMTEIIRGKLPNLEECPF